VTASILTALAVQCKPRWRSWQRAGWWLAIMHFAWGHSAVRRKSL